MWLASVAAWWKSWWLKEREKISESRAWHRQTGQPRALCCSIIRLFPDLTAASVVVVVVVWVGRVANPLNWSVSRRRRIIEPDSASETTALTLTDSGRPSTVDRNGDGTGTSWQRSPPTCRCRRVVVGGGRAPGGSVCLPVGRQIKRHTVQQLRLLVVNDRPTGWPCCCSFPPSVDVPSSPTSHPPQHRAPTELPSTLLALFPLY